MVGDARRSLHKGRGLGDSEVYSWKGTGCAQEGQRWRRSDGLLNGYMKWAAPERVRGCCERWGRAGRRGGAGVVARPFGVGLGGTMGAVAS